VKSSSSQAEEKEKETIEEKINARKERSLLSRSYFALSLLVLASGLLFLPFISSAFPLASSSSQT
jgi:hypothetical protein